MSFVIQYHRREAFPCGLLGKYSIFFLVIAISNVHISMAVKVWSFPFLLPTKNNISFSCILRYKIGSYHIYGNHKTINLGILISFLCTRLIYEGNYTCTVTP